MTHFLQSLPLKPPQTAPPSGDGVLLPEPFGRSGQGEHAFEGYFSVTPAGVQIPCSERLCSTICPPHTLSSTRFVSLKPRIHPASAKINLSSFKFSQGCLFVCFCPSHRKLINTGYMTWHGYSLAVLATSPHGR